LRYTSPREPERNDMATTTHLQNDLRKMMADGGRDHSGLRFLELVGIVRAEEHPARQFRHLLNNRQPEPT